MITGVLFDYSGTLFHLEPHTDWLDGHALDPAYVVELLTSPATFRHLPAALIDAWQRRDLDQRTHRMVYLEVLRAALPGQPPELLDMIYESVPDPRSWTPYPDTRDALRGLHGAGIAVGVISNIPWDISAVFELNGMADLVDAYALSYAEGVMKPDPAIFLTACRRIGVDPRHTLMIGDNEEADGGARRIGCRFAAVERLVPARRPRALLDALAAHGLPG